MSSSVEAAPACPRMLDGAGRLEGAGLLEGAMASACVGLRLSQWRGHCAALPSDGCKGLSRKASAEREGWGVD